MLFGDVVYDKMAYLLSMISGIIIKRGTYITLLYLVMEIYTVIIGIIVLRWAIKLLVNTIYP